MEFLGQDKREGLGRRAHSRFVLILLILVSGILLLSSLYSAEASVFRKARESVLDAASPVLELFSGPISFVHSVAGEISDYFKVLEQNEALRAENAELRQWMNEALELRKIVAGYEGLGAYEAPPKAQPVNAFVIGETNDAFAQSMIVNAGRRRNVEVGQAVVDNAGLIGRIVDAGGRASRVLLLTDVQSRIPVYVEGADIEGILVGRNRRRPVINIIESGDVAEFQTGQRILTSGAGGVLPRDLPVGVVSALDGSEVIIDLYANYAQTRVVRIINYEFPRPEDDNGAASEAGLDNGSAAAVDGAAIPDATQAEG